MNIETTNQACACDDETESAELAKEREADRIARIAEGDIAAPVLARTGHHSVGYKIARLASGLSAGHDADPETYERDFLRGIADELHGLASLAFAMETNDDVTPNQLNGLLYSLKLRVEAASDLFWEMRQARAKEMHRG